MAVAAPVRIPWVEFSVVSIVPVAIVVTSANYVRTSPSSLSSKKRIILATCRVSNDSNPVQFDLCA